MFEFITRYFIRPHIIKVNNICDMPNQEMLEYSDWKTDNIILVYDFNMFYKFFSKNPLYVYKGTGNSYIVQSYHKLYEWVQLEFNEDMNNFTVKVNSYKRSWHYSLFITDKTGFYKLALKIINKYI